jgi:hypothetical protein
MSSRHQTTVVFACPKCGAIYQATQYQVPDPRFGIFNCLACHTQVYAWNGLYDFLDWKAGDCARSNQPRTSRLHPLIREWTRASKQDQAAFLEWVSAPKGGTVLPTAD